MLTTPREGQGAQTCSVIFSYKVLTKVLTSCTASLGWDWVGVWVGVELSGSLEIPSVPEVVAIAISPNFFSEHVLTYVYVRIGT